MADMMKFLRDLEALMESHGIRIVDGSCRCCGYTKLVDADGQSLGDTAFDGPVSDLLVYGKLGEYDG